MVLASDAPHVSFLGFDPVLGRLDPNTLAVEPTARSSWLVLGRSAKPMSEYTLVVEPAETVEAKVESLSVEAVSTHRDGDRWVTRADMVVGRDAPFSVQEWWLESHATDRHRQLRPSTRMVDSGRIKRGRVRWAGVVRPEPDTARRPTCVPWTWSRLAEHDAAKSGPPIRVVNVLDGLSTFASGVRWQSCGRMVWNGCELRGYRVFGPSYSLRHIWVGPGGATVFELGLDCAIVRRRVWETSA